MGGSVEGAWRCDDLEEEEVHFFMHSHWGFVFGKGGRGKYVRGPREKEGEGEGEEGVSRSDGGRYDCMSGKGK